MVERGKVRVNARIVKKPGAQVKLGDTLTLVQAGHVRVVTIAAFADRRGPASEAQLLYSEDDNEL